MIKFETESGSTYEVDCELKKIRRLAGKGPSTRRVGHDGDWKEYSDLTNIEVGRDALIVWNYVGAVAKSTLTSRIVKVDKYIE